MSNPCLSVSLPPSQPVTLCLQPDAVIAMMDNYAAAAVHRSQLQQQVASLSISLANRESAIEALHAEIATLQQVITELRASVPTEPSASE